jgi:cobyrinic acid a,c-diamide synthase
VYKNEDLVISERHLGLVPSNEIGESARQITRMARLIRDQVDLDALRSLADTAVPPSVPESSSCASVASGDRIRIGYAKDESFGFYYAGDLEALQAAGADMLPFSPLHDQTLPDCDGLFLGGGFPESHMQLLEANTGMRAAIADFIERGGPVYAECGGLMYLCERLTWNGNTCRMAGVIPAAVRMHAKPQGRGYVQLRETNAHPWPMLAGGDDTLSAHEFHYSALEELPEGFEFAYRVERGFGLDGEHDGLCYKNLLASYAHLRHTRSHPWAERFADFVRQRRTSVSEEWIPSDER